jgi:hypothetical protein
MTDALLEWLSFRQTGRVDDVPAELLDGAKARWLLDTLTQLGHVEVDAVSWRVAPPVLAGTADNSDDARKAVLCGGRTAGVLRDLAASCDVNGASLTIEPQVGAPALVAVFAASEFALSQVAAGAGLPFQRNASFTLLSCTPTVAEWPRTRCAMAAGRLQEVSRFSGSELRWTPSTPDYALSADKGFFRIKRDFDKVYILKTGADDCSYIDPRAGRLAAAAKRRAASWDGVSQRLSVPLLLYPPSTVARALALCTGRVPHVDWASRAVSFAGITREVLRPALAIIGLRLA